MALPSGASKRGDGVPHWNVALATGPPSALQVCQWSRGGGEPGGTRRIKRAKAANRRAPGMVDPWSRIHGMEGRVLVCEVLVQDASSPDVVRPNLLVPRL